MNVQALANHGDKNPERRISTPSVTTPEPGARTQDTVEVGRPTFAEPSLSPDGKELAFVSGGDIWTAPSEGGEARLLLSDPATEARPLFSPDGKQLAFVSNRSGSSNIYTLNLDTGRVKRITYTDAADSLEAWSPDGRFLYFSNGSQDISACRDIYRVSAEGGTPMPVSADRFTDEYFAAPSPDGSALAFTGHGTGTYQWWRNGHSNLDRSQIWLLEDGSYEQFTGGDAKDMWPMWSPDGNRVYFVSDRSGTENLWVRARDEQEPRQLTHFDSGRVLWPSISPDGKTIVFERDSRIFRFDTESQESREVPIARRGAPAGPAVEHRSLKGQTDSFALSPDGKKVAFVAHGEIFAGPAGNGGPVHRVTRTPVEESSLVWAPGSRHLAYVSERDGGRHLYLYDFVSRQERQLTAAGGGDANPCFSPDGTSLAFVRDGKTLCSLDLATGQERELAQGHFDEPPFQMRAPLAWSPDGRWLAYRTSDENAFNNAWVVPAEGGDSRPVSFLANTYGDTLSWSPDGKFLLLDSAQRTENRMLTRVDLVPPAATFAEDTFADLFKPEQEEGEPETPAVTIDFDGIRERQQVLRVPLDFSRHLISPDGKQVLLEGVAGGQSNLFLYPLEGENRQLVQLTNTPGGKSDAQFSPDQSSVYYLEDGSVKAVSLEDGNIRALDLAAEMDVDFSQEKHAVFQQAWTAMRDNFYDPDMHGVDWDGLRQHYEPLITGAATPDEMRRQLSLMIGELNASHLGVAGGRRNGAAIGRTGLAFDRQEYESTGRLRVSQVLPDGPAAQAGIQAGEVLTAVNGQPLKASTNLDELLAHQVGRKVSLSVAGAEDGETREVDVQPIDGADERELRYRHWVEHNRERVAELSGGRLGYVHIPDMSYPSLQKLYLDLDSVNQAREGVVIDIRNNNGGFVNAYALDVFARQGYLSMTRRDFPTAPARRMLGQRALERPTILLTNRQTLSDGEDFTEGYRALKLGKVVGEPTSGWIIFTSGVELVDGTMMRLPMSEIRDNEGQNMEMNPRPVDVPVDRPLGESYTGRDVQLETAVAELLDQLQEKES